MAISSEIEKLEKRWQATSGLVFAPLAEAYRKAGLQARALEILEQGLALHADYGPALIVRARCHLDTGDFSAAEEAFNQALIRDTLDPIALRGLADVCERTGRIPEAIERLRALVDVDPRNNEARAVLDRLMATPAEIPEVIAAAPAPEPVQEYLEPVGHQLASLDFDVVNLSAVESLPAIPEERTGPVEEEFVVQSFAVEPLEVPEILDAPGPLLWTPAPVQPLIAPEPEPVAAFEPEHEQSPESEPVFEAVVESAAVPEPDQWPEPEPLPEPELEPELIEIVAPAEAAAPLPEPAPEPSFESFPEPVMEPVAEAPAMDEMVFEELSVEESAPEVEEMVPLVEEPAVEEYAMDVAPPVHAEPVEVAAEHEAVPEFHPEPVEAPALIVTESMAELFLKQGHRELALAVYRQLAERSPDSDSLQGAIARLEQELAPPPSPKPQAPPRRPYAAAETGGRSVERRLQAVLHAPPPSTASTVLPPAIEPGAEPTRPSADALSLAAVFGDEPAKARREEEPVAEASAAEPSYDEFFGAGPTEPAAAPTPRGEGEDLRQFNEWLKGLKR